MTLLFLGFPLPVELQELFFTIFIHSQNIDIFELIENHVQESMFYLKQNVIRSKPWRFGILGQNPPFYTSGLQDIFQNKDGSTVILLPFRQQITPLWSYLTYVLLQIILSVSKSNLTEQLLPQNRWRLYCYKIILGVSLLSRNNNWGHVTYSFWAPSLYVSCFMEFERAESPVRRKIIYIITL